MRTRMSESCAQAETQSPSGARPNPHSPGTGEYYLWQIQQAEEELADAKSHTEVLAAKDKVKAWVETAEAQKINLSEARQAQLDPLRRLLANPDLMEHNEETLRAVANSIKGARALGADELSIKKKWLRLIDETLRLQAEARSNPVYLTIYVVRCQQTNDVLVMEQIHIDFFRIWNDPDQPNTVIMAPPGVGKTTCLYGQELSDMQEDQRRRFVKLCCDMATAQNRVGVVRVYALHRRMLAVYPHLRIDTGRSDNMSQFTLMRPNIGSQDPTMVAKGAKSEIQGAGLERIHCDDLCGMKVRREPSTRKAITEHFKSAVLTRRRDLTKSRTRYIATPWAVDDTTCIVAREIAQGLRPGWRVHRFRVEEDADGNPIPLIRRGACGDANELLTIKRTDPVGYACSYRLDPRDESLRRLRKIHYYDISGGRDPLCPKEERIVHAERLRAIESAERWAVLDPGMGGADETGMVGFSLSPNGRAAIRWASFFGGKSTEAIDHVEQVVMADSSEQVLIESQGPGKGTADYWAEYLIARLGADFRNRIYFSGTRMRDGAGKPVGQNISKGQRYVGCISYLEGATILLPGRWVVEDGEPKLICCANPALEKLHDQLLNYPNVASDHGVDCVSLFINYHVGRLVRSVESLRKPGQTKGRTGKGAGIFGEALRLSRQQWREPEAAGKNEGAAERGMFAA